MPGRLRMSRGEASALGRCQCSLELSASLEHSRNRHHESAGALAGEKTRLRWSQEIGQGAKVYSTG